jgi:exonuclease III
VCAWNCNGLTDSKTLLYDLSVALQAYDVILFSETRRDIWDDSLLPGYSVAFVPASRPGQPGEGLALAVRHSPSYIVYDWGSNCTALWVKLQFQCGTCLLVGSSYVPPQGSPQLQEPDLSARFTGLTRDVMAARQEGLVLLGGDFNAHVGRTCMGVASPRPNRHGSYLLDLCQDTELTLCTGRVPGDLDVTPTYHATVRSRATRPDHVLVCPSCLPHVVSSVVLPQSWGSDHFPIVMQLRLPIEPVPHEPCQGEPLARMAWDPSRKGRYVGALLSPQQPHLRACCDAVDQGDIGAAFHAFHQGIMDAAGAAGMRLRRRTHLGRQAHVHNKPFFDQECMALKRQLHRKARSGGIHTEEYKLLERQYHTLVRAKRRAFLVSRLRETLRERRDNPRAFWRRLRVDVQPLPLSLCRVQVWEDYLGRVAVHPHSRTIQLPLESHPVRPLAQAEQLEAPIAEEEVLAALHQLHNGRAPGFHGYPSELLRAAQPDRLPGEPPEPHILAPVLTRVLDLAFQTGVFPSEFNQSLVTPVFKKGDAGDPNNYRPIAVGEPIARLYAHILGERLISFTEQFGLRAPTQAGFRPGLSTVHNLFTLQHFVDKATPKEPLYCCFLDLQGAYDTVPRDALWEALRRLGIRGQMLGALQSLYTDSTVRMKVQGRTGVPLPSQTGLKQGCPLSPTLFGLFVDGLFHYLDTHCPDDGVLLGSGLRIRILGYADDFVLLSNSQAGLQRLIDRAHGWCVLVGMLVSVLKTQVMVFKDPLPLPTPLTCAGQPLECVLSYKYLGCVFTSPTGMGGTLSRLNSNMWSAYATLCRQYGKLGCAPALGLFLDLFSACVTPTACYGCEVWSFLALPTAEQKLRNKVRLSQVRMLREIAGVRSTVSTAILFRELQVSPLDHVWWSQAVRFWEDVRRLPSDHVYYQVLQDNCRDAVARGVRNWAFGFFTGLRRIGYPLTIRCDTLISVDPSTVRCLIQDLADRVWQDLGLCPRTCPSSGAQLCTYLRWFARPAYLPHRTSVLRLPLGLRRLRLFLRFRMGCHDLPSDAGRRMGVPRLQRVCPRCSIGEVGDERHLVFTCPALEHIRGRYRHLFGPRTFTMVQFLWQEDMVSVARFVTDCFDFLRSADSPSNQP